MALQNPHSGDAGLGEAWEQGYLAGYAEPETDHLRPFVPEILDAYLAGEQAGRDERRRLPPDQGGDASSEHSQLAEIAAEVRCSPVYLTQVFQQVEGLPLYRYQLRLRLARALDLLAQYDDLTRLSLELGFSSHSHFSAAFREAYGRTPSEFRHSALHR